MLSNLGNALRARYERTGVVDDLDRAIELFKQAVDAAPTDHSEEFTTRETSSPPPTCPAPSVATRSSSNGSTLMAVKSRWAVRWGRHEALMVRD